MPAQDDLTLALLAETATKADLVWVQVGEGPAKPLWHVWHNEAVAVVTGGREQPDPQFSDGDTVQLILRSKDKATRVLRIDATSDRLDPTSPQWIDAAKALHPKRLNATDGEAQPERWAQESTIWLLHPNGDPAESPGQMSAESLRTTPVPSEATTDNWRPFHAGKATRRRR